MEILTMQRRRFVSFVGALVAGLVVPLPCSAKDGKRSVIGAAWRGPGATDPYFAGTLIADWETKQLSIGYAVPLPSRPHGLIAEPGGDLLVLGVRPGDWLLRCDGTGRVVREQRIAETDDCRLGGHAIVCGKRLLCTETDYATGRGCIGVRDLATLEIVDRWDSHGLDPHQLLADGAGAVFIANGGVPRNRMDRKFDLARMDASLVRLDANSGALTGQWRLSDPRLSLRHLALSTDQAGTRRLGIALQAEHDAPALRAAAPVLAVFDGERLFTPEQGDRGGGYAGDIASAGDGGFVLSSNQVGLVQHWSPHQSAALRPVVQLEQAYALASTEHAGFVVATALGIGRWHPSEAPALLRWPQPMALDNHWVLFDSA
jgi:hypothetical protein